MKTQQLWEDAVSSFSVIPIIDKELPENPLVLWVYNNEELREDGSKKPAGFGLPGGGMEEEDFESPETAAQGELRKETGLEVEYFSTQELFCIPRIIVTGPGSRRLCRPVPIGEWPPNVRLDRGQRGRRERFYVFTARAKWNGSKLRAFVQEYGPDAFVPGEGMKFFFRSFPQKRIEGLWIEEAIPNERGEAEIGGMAFVTPGFIRRLAAAESYEDRRGFYKSHLEFAVRAMDELGL